MKMSGDHLSGHGGKGMGKINWFAEIMEAVEKENREDKNGGLKKGQSRELSNRKVSKNELDIEETNIRQYKQPTGEEPTGEEPTGKESAEKKKFANLDPEEETTKKYTKDKKPEEIQSKITNEWEGKKKFSSSNRNKPKKILYMGIIMDGTLSFSKPYPKVYSVLEQFFKHLEEDRQYYKEIDLRYGLTVFHDEAIPMVFDNGKRFTDRESDVLKELGNLQFYGGGENGREKLRDAIAQQLIELNKVPEADDVKNCYKGILMFTDSLPEDNDMNPDFTQKTFEKNGVEYPNYGLRFADFYAYNDDFVPAMRMVNRNGREDENDKNMGLYHDLHDLLEQDAETTAAFVERMIHTIADQASMD